MKYDFGKQITSAALSLSQIEKQQEEVGVMLRWDVTANTETRAAKRNPGPLGYGSHQGWVRALARSPSSQDADSWWMDNI